MKSGMIQIGMLAAALGSVLAVAKPEVRVTCLRAGGYYGAVRAHETGGKVVIDVKGGLDLHPNQFLSTLNVNAGKGHVGNIKFSVPAESCEVSKENPLVLSCHSEQAVAAFKVERGPVQTVKLSHLSFTLEEIASLVGGEISKRIQATVTAIRDTEGGKVSAVLTDAFGTRDAASHEGCRAL